MCKQMILLREKDKLISESDILEVFSLQNAVLNY